jgi:hypothetical protein
VGIDRAEEVDAAERVPARRADADAEADAAPAPDLREQAAENARYRSLVDAAAARGAWAQELPGFRSAWERHEDRYPERARPTPHTQPDGSWVAGPDRKLDPEQNAEASKACADIRQQGTDDLRPAVQRVEAADSDRQLAGLEHMLKGEDRLKEKIADALRARPELTVEQALAIVPDPVRFTFTYGMERYADGVCADVERLKAEGFELVKLKNLWTDDQYKGINSQWRRPETGLRFEMQFHTPESLEAKELTHKAYERLRGKDTSRDERGELETFQRQVNALLVTPPGTAEIEDFPEKNHG